MKLRQRLCGFIRGHEHEVFDTKDRDGFVYAIRLRCWLCGFKTNWMVLTRSSKGASAFPMKVEYCDNHVITTLKGPCDIGSGRPFKVLQTSFRRDSV